MLKNGAAIPRYDKVAIIVVGLNTGTAGGFARELSDEPCHFSVSFLRLSEERDGTAVTDASLFSG